MSFESCINLFVDTVKILVIFMIAISVLVPIYSQCPPSLPLLNN